MPAGFVNLIGNRADGSQVRWGVGGLPITPAIEAMLLASIPPPLPNLLMKIAPAVQLRGNGWDLLAGGTLSNAHIEGFEQNITIKGSSAVTVLNNVRSLKAWRSDAAEAFEGQGAYIDHCGPVFLRGCVFGWNGWIPGRVTPAKNAFRHGVYQNVDGGFVTAEDCIFVENASAGIQLRNGGVLRRCVLLGNSLNLLAVRGDVTLEDCTIYTAQRHVLTNGPTATGFSGNNGVYAYTQVKLNGTWFVGKPGQEQPNSEIANLKSQNCGALCVDRNHRDNPGSTGTFVASGDCRVVGWPDASPGIGEVRPAGVTYGGAPVTFDYLPILSDVFANKISVPAGAAAIAAGVRGLVK